MAREKLNGPCRPHDRRNLWEQSRLHHVFSKAKFYHHQEEVYMTRPEQDLKDLGDSPRSWKQSSRKRDPSSSQFLKLVQARTRWKSITGMQLAPRDFC